MREESYSVISKKVCGHDDEFAPWISDLPNVSADSDASAPNQAWVADFTSIRLRSAFVYLACILDAFSRRCVGWHLSREMNTQMTSRDSPSVHRGREYASREYVEQLQTIDAQIISLR